MNKDDELTIARFIEGLSPNTANKVELQPYLAFDDVCNLAIKIAKQLKKEGPSKLPPQTSPKAPPRVSPPTAM